MAASFTAADAEIGWLGLVTCWQVLQSWFECQIQSWATAFAFHLTLQRAPSTEHPTTRSSPAWLRLALAQYLAKWSVLEVQLWQKEKVACVSCNVYFCSVLLCIFSHIDRMSSCWGSGEDEYNNINPNINNNSSRSSGSSSNRQRQPQRQQSNWRNQFHWENVQTLGAPEWLGLALASDRRREIDRERGPIHELITSFVVDRSSRRVVGINPACADVCEFPDQPSCVNESPVGCVSLSVCVWGAPSCRAMHILWMKWSTAELRNC